MLIKYLRLFIKNYLMTFFAIMFIIAYWMSAHSLPLETIRYPIFITGVLAVMIGWNIWLSIAEFRRVYHEVGDDKKKYDISLGFDKKKLIVVAATVLYALVLPIVGYIVSTYLYLGAMGYFLGVRKLARLAAYAFVITAFCYLVFNTWLRVQLPTGFLI